MTFVVSSWRKSCPGRQEQEDVLEMGQKGHRMAGTFFWAPKPPGCMKRVLIPSFPGIDGGVEGWRLGVGDSISLGLLSQVSM